MKRCLLCESPFDATRSRTLFCSQRCSNTHSSRQRYAAERGRIENLTSKECNCCGVDYPLEQYSRNKKLLGGLQNQCKSCLAEKKLFLRYNITKAEYDAMVVGQEGQCQICREKPDKLVVDHDHKCCSGDYSCGRCIRGLLCGSCNRALGLFLDDYSVVLGAAFYLLEQTLIGGEVNHG